MPQNTSSSSSLFAKLSSSTRSSWISPKEVKCTVQLLDDQDLISNEFSRSTLAQTVLDYVCQLKNIEERDFLGLRYQDKNKHRYWVDLSKPISHFVKQFKSEHLSLRLRFRFYPTNPTRLRDQNLRYQLFVQLQRDLLHGRLYCPQSQSANLAALLLQSQLGDFNPEIHQEGYVSAYKLLLKQTPKLEEKITELHKQMIGKSKEEAELEFLEKASLLETYGFDPYTISQSSENTPVYLGATPKGVLIFVGTQKAHQISWADLTKVNYSGKEIKLQLKDSYSPPAAVAAVPVIHGDVEAPAEADVSTLSKASTKSGKGESLKYTCPSEHFAKHLWTHLLSQQAFFNESTVDSIKPQFSKPKIPLFSRGSTFRYPARRVYREIETSEEPLLNQTAPDHLPSGNRTMDTVSVTSTRYELPRQDPRPQQPWLNGHVASKTLPIQKNDEEVYQPSTSSSPEENNNSTRRLLDFSIESSPLKDEPVFTTHTITNSTKNQGDAEDTAEKKLAEGSSFRPTSASTPYTEPKLTNGHAKKNGILKKEESTTTTTSSSGVTRILNIAFALLLILLLTIAVCIAVLERPDGSPDWVERNKALSVLRHDYYEPAREFTIKQYHHLMAAVVKRN